MPKKFPKKRQWIRLELVKKNIKGIKKLLTLTGWKYFFKILTKKEKIAFLCFFVLALSSSIFLLTNFYLKNTKIGPAQGGTHIEGVVGQPRLINPVYANSDVDRDLLQLTFSGLMKYDKNLNIVPDLAQDYTIEEDGKIYTFYLKENLVWQDKEQLTADDIIFTIKTIQNPDFKSPQRASWVGVEVEKVDNLTVRFKLKKPYVAFLENSTVKILPEHIWQKVPPESFAFQTQNLKPIGSGPFQVKEVKKNGAGLIESITLVRNPYYFDKPHYISEIKFLFFENQEQLIKAAEQNKIKALGLSSNQDIGENWQSYSFSLPRYFALFFNQEESKVLSYKEVRLALNYGTNKKELGQKIVDSPILPEIYNFEPPSKSYQFDLEKAKLLLEETGFKDEDGNGLREKIIKKEPAFKFKNYLAKGSEGKEVTELQKCLEGEVTGYFGPKTEQLVIEFQKKYIGEVTGTVGPKTRVKLNEVCFGEPEEILPLKMTLVTVDQPQMLKVAETLKNQWQELGLELEIEKYPLFQLEQDFIKPRNYQALLFGELLGALPDPFPFWHSSQTKDPGLNLALYENKKADNLLEESRKLFSAEKLVEFQNILIEDAPALFLYSPDYIYFVSKEIKGLESGKIIDPSKRFLGIENWYVKTKRVWR